jgi:hypothetical protein
MSHQPDHAYKLSVLDEIDSTTPRAQGAPSTPFDQACSMEKPLERIRNFTAALARLARTIDDEQCSNSRWRSRSPWTSSTTSTAISSSFTIPTANVLSVTAGRRSKRRQIMAEFENENEREIADIVERLRALQEEVMMIEFEREPFAAIE